MKSLTAILAAATVAAVVTLMSVSVPSAPVSAGSLPAAEAASMHACAQRPWPYLNCVGTRFGNPHIRLVTTDRLR
jgi:hypothetical protein